MSDKILPIKPPGISPPPLLPPYNPKSYWDLKNSFIISELKLKYDVMSPTNVRLTLSGKLKNTSNYNPQITLSLVVRSYGNLFTAEQALTIPAAEERPFKLSVIVPVRERKATGRLTLVLKPMSFTSASRILYTSPFAYDINDPNNEETLYSEPAAESGEEIKVDWKPFIGGLLLGAFILLLMRRGR